VEIADHIEELRAQGARLAAAATSAGPDADVPSCPEWVVRDLVRHVGGVHRWATAFVAGAHESPSDVDFERVAGPMPSDAELVDWFVAGYTALAGALSGAPADLQCWSFMPAPSPLAFWARRQAHETAIHRVDAELATGAGVSAVPPRFAADGVDEMLGGFVPRPRTNLHADPPVTLAVRCADDDAPTWRIAIGPDAPVMVRDAQNATLGVDCLVRGRAEDIYLTLWSRRDESDLDVEGDVGVLRLFLDSVHVRMG
jgi:uncharacterized protein (TIGR03083 family)